MGGVGSCSYSEASLLPLETKPSAELVDSQREAAKRRGSSPQTRNSSAFCFIIQLQEHKFVLNFLYTVVPKPLDHVPLGLADMTTNLYIDIHKRNCNIPYETIRYDETLTENNVKVEVCICNTKKVAVCKFS